ncbi:MAG: ATP-binding protein [Verrucomicrobiaceae bacterium]|nr:ATP-binding protein [Verrucomicrobiaceae bacterium]
MAAILPIIISGSKYLPDDLTDIIRLNELHTAAPWLSAACWIGFGLATLFLFATWWRRLELPPRPPPPPALPLLGPRPFTLAQGDLFQLLERRNEIDQLINAVQDSTVALVAVRGESGAGKTSLLRSGFAWQLQNLGAPCIYVEMRATGCVSRLVSAIQSSWNQNRAGGQTETPPVSFAQLLAFPGNPVTPPVLGEEPVPSRVLRRIIILDQFEQFPSSGPERESILAFLRSVAAGNPPHHFIIIVSFRREYLADWQDIVDKEFSSMPPSAFVALPVYYFTKVQAKSILAQLCATASLDVDDALAVAYIDQVVRSNTERCIAPVDLAIFTLSLVDRQVRTGRTRIGIKDFRLSGGAAGMLEDFLKAKVQDRVQQPAAEAEVYQALISLVEKGGKGRVMEGVTVAQMAKNLRVLTPETLLPVVQHLEGPAARLLEIVSPDPEKPASENASQDAEPSAVETKQDIRYRLTHDRLVEAVNRLGKQRVAEEMQAQALLEDAYRGSLQFGERVFLNALELRLIEKSMSRFNLGADADAKLNFFLRSKRRRFRRATILSVCGLILAAAILWSFFYLHARDQRAELRRMGLPGDLYDYQQQLSKLELTHRDIDSLSWISGHLESISVIGNVRNPRGIGKLPRSLCELDMTGNPIGDWSWLKEIRHNVTSLSVPLPNRPSGLEEYVYPEFTDLPKSISVLELMKGVADYESHDDKVLRDFRQVPLSVKRFKLHVDDLSEVSRTKLPLGVEFLEVFCEHSTMPDWSQWPKTKTLVHLGNGSSNSGELVSDYPWISIVDSPREYGHPGSSDVQTSAQELSLTEHRLVIAGTFESESEALKNLPPRITELQLGEPTEWAINAELATEEYEALVQVPKTVKLLVIHRRIKENATLLNKLPTTIEEIELGGDEAILKELSPVVLAKVVKLDGVGHDELADVKVLVSMMPKLRDLSMNLQPGFGDLRFLSSLTQLTDLNISTGYQRFDGSDSLEGLPAGVRHMDITTNAGP